MCEWTVTDGVQTLIFKPLLGPIAEKFISKISIFGATGCRILMLKSTKFDFRLRTAPDPTEELTALPTPSGCIQRGL